MLRIIRRLTTALFVASTGLAAAGCGGGGGPTSPPPPPPGPPPPPPIGASLSMQPGEIQVLTDASTFRSFEIVGGPDAREYQVIVMSAGQTEDGLTPLRLTARAQGSASIVPVPSAATTSYSEPPPVRRRSGFASLTLDEMARARPAHLALRGRMQEELRRSGARAARSFARTGVRADLAASRSSATAVPAVDDVVRVQSAIVPGGGLSCNASTPIDGVVKSVGQNFIIVEDPAAAGLLTAADYAEMETEVDAFVAPVDQEYFGNPADLDGNGRTIALFTRQVNRLADPASGTIVLGFFTSLDIADPASCPSSNEAEIIWLLAPDPAGDVGPPIPASFVKGIARGLIAHEFQHLLNAEQRITIGGGSFGSSEESWMNEGMSHIAEEVTGLHRIGMGTRGDFGYAEISAGPLSLTAFGDFQQGNFLNVDQYLSAPSALTALSSVGADFNTRGFGYLFLRWLGDRYGPAAPVGILPGSGEHLLYSELSSGGPGQMRGIDNVLRAINVVSGESVTWDEVLAEYFAAPAVDGALASLSPDLQFSTWDLPRLYSEMQAASVQGLAGGYPLRPRIVTMGAGVSSTNNFDLMSSTARYFTFRSDGAHPDMAIAVTAQTGGVAPNGARASVIVVRTR